MACTTRTGTESEPRRAFSLVELLVVIAIIAVLLSLLLPSLAGARNRATDVRGLSDMRQMFTMIAGYTNEYGGMLPFVAVPHEPGELIHRLDPSGEPIGGGESYFRANAFFYADALKAAGFDPLAVSGRSDEQIEDFYRKVHRSHVPTSLFFTHAASAAPAFWSGQDPPFRPGDFDAQPISDVLHPAAKAALIRTQFGADDELVGVAMFDGSASTRPYQGFETFTRRFGVIPWVGMMTEDGLRGRDY